MTAIALDSATTPPPTPPSTPRVRFAPVRARQAVLDGGWWPRSTDPDVELPGLVHVLSERYGPIRQLMLNRDVWDARPRRLTVDARMVRLGWFASVDPALAIAWLQVTYKLIPLQGGSFLIDYYPVKLKWPDFVLVAVTVLFIALIASWIPARKAARQEFSLRAE